MQASKLENKLDSLHELALAVTRNYKHSEAELLKILEDVRRERVFLHKGYRSLYEYANKCLGLSEGISYALQAVLKKSDEVPELKLEVVSGGLNLQAARRVVSVITPENKDEWLKKAKELPQRVLEYEVAKENPKAAVPTREKAVSADLIELRFGLSRKDLIALKRAQDLLSQKERRCVDLADTVAVLAEYYNKREDPIQRAERAMKKTTAPAKDNRKEKPNNATLFRTKVNFRKPLPAPVKHFVYLRDKGQCTFRHKNGERCDSKRFLDFHHVIPVASGGKDTADNVKLICSAHHRLEHLSTPNDTG